MRKTSSVIVGLLVWCSVWAFGGAPDRDLTPQAAVKLVSLKSGVPENTIEIPFLIDGSSKCDGGFEVSHVRRVAAIHAVTIEARKTRTLVFYDLFWNESLGWFMWESRAERGGDAVYIWSELKGSIVNR